ncbi:hypothetical protein [Amycolatopsis cihanbeyliensis]|uniref:hypothetical protein n=1 Tax=Amycolatopsis cihanbeyliensis TaxID=1128664 RepID=UPI001476B9C1|nr:hypothetical protein [Amycolatopsis cihanbeyliensis]
MCSLPVLLGEADPGTATGLPAGIAPACRAFRQAQARLRREHALVCRRLVPEGRSLLEQSRRFRNGRLNS